MTDTCDIAIIGMSCAFPGSSSLATYWDSIDNGQTYFRPVPPSRWNHRDFFSRDKHHTDATYASRIAYLDDITSFAPETFKIPPRRAHSMDPQQRLILAHARLAIEDAGYGSRTLPRTTGVYVGASVVEYKDLVVSRLRARQIMGGAWGIVPPLPDDAAPKAVQAIAGLHQYSMLGIMPNMIACNVSEAFDFGGPALVTDAACSSALVAMHEAVLHLRAGTCDAAIVGGVYTICTPDLLVGFSRIGAVSRTDACRPFDASADGFVLGEGVGVVLLKRLRDATRDGDRIRATVKGVGLNNDGRSDGPMTPRLGGQIDALERAYKDAGVSPGSVCFVEAHGTATPVGDATEIAALQHARNLVKPSRCAVTSVKGNIGHSLSASGMAALIKTVLAFERGVIPPQAGLQTRRDALKLDGSGIYIPSEPVPFERNGAPRRAGVSAFGFGGTNVHVVLEEPRPQSGSAGRRARGGQSSRREFFVVSADTKESLDAYLGALIDALPASADSLRDVAFTITLARRMGRHSVAVTAAARDELVQQLILARRVVAGEAMDGIAFVSASDAVRDPIQAAVAKLGGPPDLQSHFKGARPVSLPITPVRTHPFWVIDETRTMSNRPGDTGPAPREQPNVADQIAALQTQLDHIQRQIDVSRGGPDATESLGTATADVATPSATFAKTDTTDSVEARVYAVLASVSSFPLAMLRPELNLTDSLGFDSLMTVELLARLSEEFPNAGPLPDYLISRETTISDLSSAVTAAIAKRAEAESSPAAPPTFQRYAVRLADCPLPPKVERLAIPFRGPVDIIGDELGVAPLLRQRLERMGVEARVAIRGDASSADVLIDLAWLNAGTETLDPSKLREPVLTLLGELVSRSRANSRPKLLCIGTRGITGVGLAGLAKAVAKEWPETVVRCVEFGAQDPATIADTILAELFATDGCVEVTYVGGARQTLAASPAPAAPTGLPQGAVVAISGGGRGLGAKIAIELARRHRARLLLLGRGPAATEVVDEIRRVGGDALYVPCDVRDVDHVARAFERARAALGAITHVIHAAGVIADAPIVAKDIAAGGVVFDTKVGGFLALWHATRGDCLASFVSLGSWAGRFGNSHQVDYSAANHAMARLAAAVANGTRTRVVTIDLPPWEGSSMVSSMPVAARQVLAARMPFLTDAAGLDALVAELTTAGESGEVIIGAGLESEPRTDHAVLSVSLAKDSWLEDHRIDGRVVLPLAMLLDEAAASAQRLGFGPALSLSDIELTDMIEVLEPAVMLTVAATVRGAGADVRLGLGGSTGPQKMRLRATTATNALPLCEIPSGGDRPPLAIEEFFASRTFHGPRMRSLVSVSELGIGHAVGSVRASSDGGPRGFSVDVLSVDGALQLCAYWAAVRLGRSGFPIGVGEVRICGRVAPGVTLRVVGVLKAVSDDVLACDLDVFSGAELTLQVRGLRCKLAPRSPEKTAASTTGHSSNFGANQNAATRIDDFPEVHALRERLAGARAMGMANPYFSVHEGVCQATSVIGGREYVNFASYNYLGLSGDPDVTAAAMAAVQKFGTSVSASRLASGERPLHGELEAELADFLGCEAAIVMVGGHATNVSLIGTLFGPQDLVLHDSLAHDSILGGIRLARAKRRPFPHNDCNTLDSVLTQVRSTARRVLIAVEGVYSMDGDIAPLDQLIEIKRRHNAHLLVDEAHSLGVLGATGRGIGEVFGVRRPDVDLWMGTLSKSLASCGGYVAGSAPVVEYLKYSNPGFVYSVGASPANCAAALAALRKMRAHPELVATLQARGRYFLQLCRERSINTGFSEGIAVIPCIVGNSMLCLRLSQALAARSINVQPILYPAVEEHLARLRFFVTERHSEAQLRLTADILAEELKKLTAHGVAGDNAPAHIHEPRDAAFQTM